MSSPASVRQCAAAYPLAEQLWRFVPGSFQQPNLSHQGIHCSPHRCCRNRRVPACSWTPSHVFSGSVHLQQRLSTRKTGANHIDRCFGIVVSTIWLALRYSTPSLSSVAWCVDDGAVHLSLTSLCESRKSSLSLSSSRPAELVARLVEDLLHVLLKERPVHRSLHVPHVAWLLFSTRQKHRNRFVGKMQRMPSRNDDVVESRMQGVPAPNDDLDAFRTMLCLRTYRSGCRGRSSSPPTCCAQTGRLVPASARPITGTSPSCREQRIKIPSNHRCIVIVSHCVQ